MRNESYTPPVREIHIEPVFTESLLRNVMEIDDDLNVELLGRASIKASAKDSLGDCLSTFTKEHLKELAEEHNLSVQTSLKKQEIVSTLSSKMVDNFPKMLQYLPVINLEFLAKFTETPTLSFTHERLYYRDISHAHNFGFLYLFKEQQGYTVVLPKELLPALSRLSSTETWDSAYFYQKLDAYAVALSNLYGVFDIDQYAIIWNRFEENTMTPAMLGDELALMGKYQYYWWFDDELVISSYFQSRKEAENFLSHVKDISYYIPTRDDLISYYRTPYNDDSSAANAMLEFLSGYLLPDGSAIEELMDEISDACIVGNEMQEVFDLLNEYGLVFSGMEEITRFTELFSTLNEQSRKWELKGHTPLALKKGSRSGS